VEQALPRDSAEAGPDAGTAWHVSHNGKQAPYRDPAIDA